MLKTAESTGEKHLSVSGPDFGDNDSDTKPSFILNKGIQLQM